MKLHNSSICHLAFGSQLFDPKEFEFPQQVLMFEDWELCTYYRFHQQKIFFFLSSMRHYREELEAHGKKVFYHELPPYPKSGALKFEERLIEFCHKKAIQTLTFFEIEDHFMEARILKALKKEKIHFQILPNPQFLCSRRNFAAYLQEVKKPFQKTFYERQRKSLQILMDGSKALGGRWSFDEENRKKLPADYKVRNPLKPTLSSIDREVQKLVRVSFSEHPGSLEVHHLATRREQAQQQLEDFLQHRLHNFGPYEDALTERSDWVEHSGISALLNVGLLNPSLVVQKSLETFQKKKIPLASIEGFIRQIIGWREFVRGIYHNFDAHQTSSNFFQHHRKLAAAWYDGTTGLRPLDFAIQKALRLGYNHHIERLMVIGNAMNLAGIHPSEVHRWFMEMYVDSSDWVMGPNVYGMALMSDGGVFATKPYICGSNYLLKMSDYPKGDWCDVWDGLYWSFIERNEEFFAKNPRLSMMTSTLQKMNPERKSFIFQKAQDWIDKVTIS
ncbi:MAG: cryptochrome/photolyase family protein [Bdellovibrio sp.]